MHAGTAGGHFGRDRTIDKICSRFYCMEVDGGGDPRVCKEL